MRPLFDMYHHDRCLLRLLVPRAVSCFVLGKAHGLMNLIPRPIQSAAQTRRSKWSFCDKCRSRRSQMHNQIVHPACIRRVIGQIDSSSQEPFLSFLQPSRFDPGRAEQFERNETSSRQTSRDSLADACSMVVHVLPPLGKSGVLWFIT
jgi:hypothetical protein